MNRDPGALFLTFDDGPDEQWTPRVLDELERCAARASFFLIAERLRRAPWVARRIAAAGHDIGLHCNRHGRHTELSEREIEADTVEALACFAEVGLFPTRWRTPWGVCTQATARVAARHGLELVPWSIDTHDWRGDSAAEMLNASAGGLQDGAIVLMHDGLGPGARRDGCENTLELLAPLCSLAAQQRLGVGLDTPEPPLSEALVAGQPRAAER